MALLFDGSIVGMAAGPSCYMAMFDGSMVQLLNGGGATLVG